MRILPTLVVTVSISTSAMVHAGTWTPLANQPTFLNPPGQCAIYENANCAPAGYFSWGAVENVNLLTDGSVLVEAYAVDNNYNPSWVEYKLIPDSSGSYINGTWKQVASIPDAATAANPNGWGPDGMASAVLPDGRVIYEGGEYSGAYFDFALSNQGAIYDPVKDSWTPVAPPSFENLYPADPPDLPGFNSVYSYPRYPAMTTSELVDAIGDSESVVLPNGIFMLASKLSKQQALLDPKTLTWTLTGEGKKDVNSEEGWTLLPNGKVLTVDTDLDYWFGLTPTYRPGNSELYDPATGKWSSAGNTVNLLTGFPDGEMGPAVLMPNGIVFAEGSEGANSLYDSYTNKWSAGPSFPTVEFGGQTMQLTATDVGAAQLPNGNVLTASDTYGEAPPTKFFEFDGRNLIPEPDTPNTSIDEGAFFLVLPTGQLLEFDSTTDVEIYTPSAPRERPAYAPLVSSVPPIVSPGNTYYVSGVYLNGVSQGAYEGDDWQMATNYPLVRITNDLTHHVFYSRTFDFSSMAVANPNPVSASFEVPANQEPGLSSLVVVTNGVPSPPVPILVSKLTNWPRVEQIVNLRPALLVGVARRPFPFPTNEQGAPSFASFQRRVGKHKRQRRPASNPTIHPRGCPGQLLPIAYSPVPNPCPSRQPMRQSPFPHCYSCFNAFSRDHKPEHHAQPSQGSIFCADHLAAVCRHLWRSADWLAVQSAAARRRRRRPCAGCTGHLRNRRLGYVQDQRHSLH